MFPDNLYLSCDYALSQHSSRLHLSSKNPFTEQILLKRRPWLYEIDENFKYRWVSVSLMYKSLRSLFQQRITSTSKKLTLSKEHSTV